MRLLSVVAKLHAPVCFCDIDQRGMKSDRVESMQSFQGKTRLVDILTLHIALGTIVSLICKDI
jgi:hypothetical protein